MVLSLDTVPRKIAVILLAAGTSFLLGSSLTKHFRVDWLTLAGTPEAIQRALELQPQNAALQEQYGRILLYSVGGEAAGGLEYLERAVALAPQRGVYAVNLAQAREQRGDLAGARRALDAARKAEPRTPQILWVAMSYALRHGENEEAMALARELLQAAPEYTSRAFPLLRQVSSVGNLIERVMPEHQTAYCELLQLIARSNEQEGAEQAWQRVQKIPGDFQPGCIHIFLDNLIQKGQVEIAQRVWNDSIRRGWIGVEPAALKQPLYNGDFRYPMLNFGFDWRVTRHPEASVWIEAHGPEAGQQSLCVQFSEEARADYQHVTHYVPVEPDSEYALKAAVRTEKIVSRSGAYLQILEVGTPGWTNQTPRMARTESWTGSNRWKETSCLLATGPKTRLVQISLRRPAAQAGDPPATGMVCVSAIEWKALGRSTNLGRVKTSEIAGSEAPK